MAQPDQAPTTIDCLPAATDEALPSAIATPESTPAAPVSDDEVIARLAALTPLEYDRVRREKAKDLGVQVKTLDELVKAARDEDGDVIRLPFAEVEPYPKPIDPAMALDEVANIIRRYVVLDKELADAAALWIAMTWFIDVVEIAPLGIITAPEKACGKSQLLDVFGRMVSRPLSAASSSASFLFRAIAAWRPTILIDEADTFIRENEELKGLVNAGHTRANAYVGRTVPVGDGYEPRLFDVWGAKAFAGIALEKHLPDATMSRGIVLNLRRKKSDEPVSRLRHAEKAVFAGITAKLARFADDYAQQVRLARPRLPDALSDRAQDNWEPLLAIAGCAGSEWVQRATAAALHLSSASEESVSTGNALLADIQDVFRRKGSDKVSTVDLIQALVADEEKPWATYNRGKPLSPRQLAGRLAAYGIKPKTVRHGELTPKGYDAAQFADAFARYLEAPQNLPPQRNGAPESMAGKAGGVADETQRSRGADAGAVMDKSPPFPSDAELPEFKSVHDRSDVSDSGPVF
ncbi:MAG: DUF3631 domain-containing protein [Rhodocyclaceae bacterium]|nr:MAG: DUF3631 domain-containing protein [Rhodocyclaceae bacterium]